MNALAHIEGTAHACGLLLAAYCVLAFGAALFGGALPELMKLTHTRLQTAVSFVAGFMLGLSLLGMLPHAADQLGSLNASAILLIAGFLAMFVLQRFLPFHHHDVAEGSPIEPCGHPHSLAERSAHHLSWMGVALGLSFHSVFDGLAMAAAVVSEKHTHQSLLGLGTALAVILHKPFSALAIITLMKASGSTSAWRRWVNVGFALVTPLAAVVLYLGFQLGGVIDAETHPRWAAYALAFCAGTFLHIATADLLPELQFHKHDRFKLTIALLMGLLIAIVLTVFAHTPHSHGTEIIDCGATHDPVVVHH